MQAKVGVFHPGTQHSWQTALAFQEADLLAWFATSVLYDPNRFPYSLTRGLPGTLRRKLERELKRREFPALNQALVEQFGIWEWLAVPLRRARLSRLARRLFLAGNNAGARRVEKLLRSGSVKALWTYDAVGLEALRVAKAAGIPSVLDQTIGHLASLDRTLRMEAERHPELFPPGDVGLPPENIERQVEELELADFVVVGSDFARGTLIENGVPDRKIHVLRYGCDDRLFTSATVREASPDRPVHFLCVGSIGPRKGTAYLLEAFKRISPKAARLTLVGPIEVNPAVLPTGLDHVTILPSVPRSEIPHMMSQADCVILPSLFEGCSISLHEAVATGLPVIHSKSSGDGLVDGNGILLPEVSADALYAAVQSVLQEPSLISAWSRRSVEMAPAHTAVSYRRRVLGFYDQWLK